MEDADKRQILTLSLIAAIPIIAVLTVLFMTYQSSQDLKSIGFSGIDVEDVRRDDGRTVLLIENQVGFPINIEKIEVQGTSFNVSKPIDTDKSEWVFVDYAVDVGIKILFLDIKYTDVNGRSYVTHGRVEGFVKSFEASS